MSRASSAKGFEGQEWGGKYLNRIQLAGSGHELKQAQQLAQSAKHSKAGMLHAADKTATSKFFGMSSSGCQLACRNTISVRKCQANLPGPLRGPEPEQSWGSVYGWTVWEPVAW